MRALFEIFAMLVVALAAAAFSHFELNMGGDAEVRRSAVEAPRSVQRTPIAAIAPEALARTVRR